MRFVVRYLGIVVFERDLSPGDYVIGRSPDCDIRLTQDFISRQHGRLYFEDDAWWYRDLRSWHPNHKAAPAQLDDDKPIELENDVDLLTAGYLDQHDTQRYNIGDLKSMVSESDVNRSRIRRTAWVLGGLMLLGGLAGLFYYATKPMAPHELLEFSRSKIVEFELKRDAASLRAIKQHAGLDDHNFFDDVGFCSGFIVKPNVVATAYHCLTQHGTPFEINEGFLIKTYDGKHRPPGRVLGFDVKRDFVFLEVDGLQDYGVLELADSYEIGQAVYTIGNVGGEGIAIRDGIMAATTKDPGDPRIEYIRYSAATSPGNSGGPLVDEYGRIVGVVFAGTQTENYNLATGAEHLKAGMAEYVLSQEPKELPVASRSILNFDEGQMLWQLAFPADSAWQDDPELFERVRDIAVVVKVPAPFSEFARDVLTGYNAAVRQEYRVIGTKLLEKGKALSEWRVHAKASPVLAVYGGASEIAFDPSTLLPLRFEALSPSTPYDYAQFVQGLKEEQRHKYVPNMVAMELVNQKSILHEGAIVYSDFTGVGPRAMTPIRQARLHGESTTNWESTRDVTADALKETFLGPEGISASTGAHPYVRPNAVKTFTIKSFDQRAATEVVTDLIGRKWKRTSWPAFARFMVDNYCLPLPQGVYCYTIALNRARGPMRDLMRENYVRYTLTPQVMPPLFWDSGALVDFYEKKHHENAPAFRDFSVEQSAGGIVVTLETIGVRYLIREAQAKMIRLLSGVRETTNGMSWVALGFEAYDPGAERVCGSEVELPGTYASLFREVDPNDETKTVLASQTEQITSERLGMPIHVTDYCSAAQVDRDSVSIARYGIEPSPVARKILP